MAGVVVVGAGHAAGALAVALRDGGYADPIALIGDEPHPPYERPPLSKGLLRGTDAFEGALVRPREWYSEAGVALHLGRRAVAVDPAGGTVQLDGGDRLDFTNLVFATGLTPLRLGIPGAGLPGIHVLRTWADCQAIAAAAAPGGRVVVVGAGLVGLEVAATLRVGGSTVTVLEAAPRPLARVLPALVADHVAGLHRARGVDLRCDASVAAFVGDGRLRSVVLTSGQALPADLAIVAIGSAPNDRLARAAGLEVRDGIVVDAGCRASLPSIHAIGDVARHRSARFDREWRLESWHNAQEQAATCARTILGVAQPRAKVPTFWTDQYDTTVQFAGLTNATTEAELQGDPATGAFSVLCRLGGELVGVVGVNRPKDVRQARIAIEAGSSPSQNSHDRKQP
ncbi:3-phenylpropionate/trans-cinnamate dioxygenase ferredoxin reductase subunit [Stella humosa]|uniref:3-phenylpropionate/trans-cinnamate dioxygenase ferredoxin reductase subunit n=1 Tax=Stella humosa TaxID=94 RepID=A0A3N1L0K6_9PROT|nr:FAD-dependent oxidoreductase [Stella humosa]ROP84559.1 3-phenylpropionate/trans-cinnamate dioxygenase ferredoxin reductase subunit [Stella humosa]BBK34079.1 putative ferredoxin reductase [Stella humosa]